MPTLPCDPYTPRMDDWVIWLILAVVLVASEVATSGLILVMFSGGALAAAVTAGIGAGPVGSAGVFAVVSLALIAVVRPIAKDHLYQAPAQRSGTAALIGTEAVVVDVVDSNDGRIKLSGEIWSARTLQEGARFEPDEKVTVLQIDGATAIVG